MDSPLQSLLIAYLQDRWCSLVASADPLELHKSLQDKAKQRLPRSNDLRRGETNWLNKQKHNKHIGKTDSIMNEYALQKTLTHWTDHTGHASHRVFVCPWPTGVGVAGPDGRLAPARGCSCNPSAQQRRTVTALAGSLCRCGRPTRRTGKWLWHPTMWTVTPCGGKNDAALIVLVPLNSIRFKLFPSFRV